MVRAFGSHHDYIELNASEKHLIAIAKLNIIMTEIESGLQSLIQGLLKVEYNIGSAITAELGSRDVEYMLKTLSSLLHPNSEFDRLVNRILPKCGDLRAYRNQVTHASWGMHSNPQLAIAYQTKAKGKLIHERHEISPSDIDNKIADGVELIGLILQAHLLIRAIW